MADSPLANSTGVLSWAISCDGTQIEDSVNLISLDIQLNVNRINTAILVLEDGDMPNADFPLSDAATFKPGAEVKIQLGYAQVLSDVFTGVVIKHSIKISSNNAARLVIECKDKAIAMTVGRKNANYIDMLDSDIISKLIGNYSGLSAADVTATTTSHKELVQFYTSDWDFMLARAEANGLLVSLDAGKVSVKAPEASGSAVLTVTYGVDMVEFHADMDARHQYSTVETYAWDLASLQVQNNQSTPVTLPSQGDITSATLAEVIGLSAFRLQSGVPLESDFLSTWAKAQQLKSGLARIRGHVSFQGSALAKPAALLELAGVGARFNGTVFISGVEHSVADGNWITRVDFGMAPQWFSEANQLESPPAAGLTAGIRGLHVGVVMKLDADPESQYKVQVSIPEMSAETDGFWARLAQFYASNSFGAFFIPEIGDEVILGFFNDDPSHPVILGSLYSSKNKPAYELTADNNTKALVTRSKMKLEFDDDKKIITLVTPGNNTIVISDDGKSILLQDQNSNKVELNSSGITLDTPKDITLTAKGKIVLNATGNIEGTAQADVKLTGLNITQTANVGFTAKGSATAEVSASGTTTIKGAMVMIN
ncbi:type VI secretion system tip protein VgrG [Cellvibrio japonicus]|uniref:Rhs element Vgr protein n=1 Tax=Cellvibrio japonicus (strain Ueda107) TaxID=498211 RepID=B3PHT3_CELJU|nr:type VI secretion system tip protein VgrG [Cellvibrio japonicus]ACE85011.1 Rhs element Vgr protein [Cellvibrio japonicus Ueda107]QEI13875.1 type VI secretion system tip protein VgrG [Cellvibrio japonicus]QEI17449.1 type VI secretion system tip protein VgrG [Cellvibrio japonicus]QEI21025.1 type VI secretion system tip protein VgrG [Cellvibrio japonicus]